MKKLALAILMISSTVFASEEMTTCTGTIKGKDLQINIENSADLNVQRVVVFNEAKQMSVYNEGQIEAGMVNVGTAKNPMLNYQIIGKNKVLKLRFVFQNRMESQR